MEFAGKISGDDAVAKVLQGLPRTMARKVYMKAMRKAAEEIKDNVKERIISDTKNPDGTGVLRNALAVYNYRKLRGSYRVGVQIKRKLVNKKKIVNGEPVRVGLYAAVREYGKANQAPAPSFRMGITDSKSGAVAILVREIKANLGQALRDARNGS